MPRGMIRLAGRLILFGALNAVLAVAFLALHESTLHRARWETDSILLVMPEGEHRDVAILGTSHAYVISRFREHGEAAEAALGRSIFNMAIPQGGGITPARFYLESYFEDGNTLDDVVYFLDPFVFFTAGSSDSHKFVYFEPFRLRFFAKMVANGYNYQQIITYVRSKFSTFWIFQRPDPLVHHVRGYPSELVTPERIERRMLTLYPEGLRPEVFARFQPEFLKILALCQARGARLHVAVPPTLMGPETGHAEMMAWLQPLADRGEFTLHDWSNAIPSPERYYNLDHLNLSGVEQLMGELLRPVLDQSAAKMDGTSAP